MGENITLGPGAVKEAALRPARRGACCCALDAEMMHLVRYTGRKLSNHFTIGLEFHANPVHSESRACRYLRIPRSAEVSASENAGRANSRSAYFMSGAACFGIWIP